MGSCSGLCWVNSKQKENEPFQGVAVRHNFYSLYGVVEGTLRREHFFVSENKH